MFSSLEADSNYMRAFDEVMLNATSYPSIETIKKDIAKVDLKTDIIRHFRLENKTDKYDIIDTLSSTYQTEFERALALRQLFYIFFERGGELGTKDYERTKTFERLYTQEVNSWQRIKDSNNTNSGFDDIIRA